MGIAASSPQAGKPAEVQGTRIRKTLMRERVPLLLFVQSNNVLISTAFKTIT